jgi:pimeloyl-ACP methyl ester carboxylesterase
MNPEAQRIDLFAETLRLAFLEQGAGRPYLLLHAGDGAGSAMGLAGALAEKGRVVLPIHPGFDGEPRPGWCTRVDHLVLAYLALLDRLDLRDVVVVGNSLGGWLAAELALRRSPRVAGAVLIDAVGIDTGSPDRTIADPDQIPPEELLARAFHDPETFAPRLVAGPALAENQRSLRLYAGEPFMHDPGLRARLAGMSAPTLVVWGESDRLIDLEYGKRYAASIPGARFAVVAKAGHLPHIERLEDTRRLVEGFVATL